jgi:hypothetical protein
MSTDWAPIRRTLFRAWTWVWGCAVVALFLPVTGLTVGLWLADPDAAQTNPVTDLSFWWLGSVIAVGFLTQLTKEPTIAGPQQAVIAAAALTAAGGIAGRVEPLTGGLVLVAAAVTLAALHPRSGDFFRRVGRVDPALLCAAAVAVLPVAWYVVHLVDASAASGPSCFLGQCAPGDRLAELAAAAVTVVLLAALASLRPGGGPLPGWSAAAGAAVIGGCSVLLPGVPGSLGYGWGAFALLWAVVVAVCVARADRRRDHDRMSSPGGRALVGPVRGESPGTARIGLRTPHKEDE